MNFLRAEKLIVDFGERVDTIFDIGDFFLW